MEDTFVGGETSSISITLWFVISGILAFATILFFYFTKVKDLNQKGLSEKEIHLLQLLAGIKKK